MPEELRDRDNMQEDIKMRGHRLRGETCMGSRASLLLQDSSALPKGRVLLPLLAAGLLACRVGTASKHKSNEAALPAPELPVCCCRQHAAADGAGDAGCRRADGSADGRSDGGAIMCAVPCFPAPSRCGSAASAGQKPVRA